MIRMQAGRIRIGVKATMLPETLSLAKRVVDGGQRGDDGRFRAQDG